MQLRRYCHFEPHIGHSVDQWGRCNNLNVFKRTTLFLINIVSKGWPSTRYVMVPFPWDGKHFFEIYLLDWYGKNKNESCPELTTLYTPDDLHVNALRISAINDLSSHVVRILKMYTQLTAKPRFVFILAHCRRCCMWNYIVFIHMFPSLHTHTLVHTGKWYNTRWYKKAGRPHTMFGDNRKCKMENGGALITEQEL